MTVLIFLAGIVAGSLGTAIAIGLAMCRERDEDWWSDVPGVP